MKNLILLISLFTLASCTQPKVKINNLQVNYHPNPVAVDGDPLFSWELASLEFGVEQLSYKIELCEDGKQVWTSGEVQSNATNHIKYTGEKLKASTSYEWTVEVKTNVERLPVQSACMCFATGLQDSGWSNAEWIRYDNVDSIFVDGKQTTKAVMFRNEFEVKKKLKSASLFTTSLGIHDLFINGQRVGHQQKDGSMIYDELKPGWTDVR
ncbi:MAG: alpha-L-rhamnosidase N-terminal domain-containing protein, partial [Mangrovibacterium sp.]